MANLSDKLAAGASVTEVSTAVDYTVVATGNVRVYVDTTTIAVDITLPAGTTGQEVEIIDAGENAGTNIITIVGTIDGATNTTIEADSASRKVVYSGTAWETSGGVDQFFTRNAATGVISCKAPDAFSADRIDAGNSGSVYGGAGVSDFSNAEANVDQGASSWSNVVQFIGDVSNSASSPYVITVSSEYSALYAGWMAFDRSTATSWGINVSAIGDSITIDYGTDKTLYEYRLGGGQDAKRSFSDWTIEGSANGSSWTNVDTRSGHAGRTLAQFTPYFAITTPTAYRYYRLTVNALSGGSGELGEVSEIQFMTKVDTSNTFQQRFLTSGGLTSFNPASLVLTNASDIELINGTVTIEYSTDNGSNWSASSSLTDFKALGAITATSFWLRYKLVGAATMKSGLIQSTATYASMTSTGLELFTTSVSQGFAIVSKTDSTTGADRITNVISLTQAEYNAITPNATTLYIING